MALIKIADEISHDITTLQWSMGNIRGRYHNRNASSTNIIEIVPRINVWARFIMLHIDGLVQERRNSSALAIELRLSCINPSM